MHVLERFNTTATSYLLANRVELLNTFRIIFNVIVMERSFGNESLFPKVFGCADQFVLEVLESPRLMI